MSEPTWDVLERTKSLLAEWRSPATRSPDSYKAIYTLLPVLGCPWVVTTAHGLNIKVGIPQMDTIGDCSPQATAALLLLLAEVAVGEYIIPIESASLLSGLWRQCLWRECLTSQESTYHLAYSVLDFLSVTSDHTTLNSYVTGDVLGLLNEWLSPNTPWADLPPADLVARHIFGEGWCALALTGNTDIAEMVLDQRPPFMHGLCPTQDDAMLNMHLPQLSP